ncbi:MAG: DUF1249 domain-containing protein [Thalassotalea sp.]|nr:DUF1249 domain-containing protein [Thalassotalea sp.]MDG2393368.1 DUF1249 domain-containing protein [Thalassotalea sp.]
MAKYKPSLKGLINSFEINYMLLTRLLADLDEVNQSREFFINEHLSYQLTVKEKSKYTHVIEFKQVDIDDKQAASKHFAFPCMLIRIYHDARLAEVIESQHIRQIKPRYDYPNPKMHQPDEKQQNHHFLTQWLQLCLSQGQTPVKLC